MTTSKRCLKYLTWALKNFQGTRIVSSNVSCNSYYHRNQHPHHRKPKCSFSSFKIITQFLLLMCVFVTLGLIVLFSYKILFNFITSNDIWDELPYPNHNKEMSTANGNHSHEQIQYKLDDFDYDDDNSNSQKQLGRNNTKNRKIASKGSIFIERKIWIRVSDEVFVYSAHLDTRNFTTFPMKNNGNLSTAQGAAGRVGGIAPEGQVVGEFANGDDVDDGDDSDKLKDILLIRIIGIKGVPPLREFIKKDILDWFRMKHEMEFSEKYECRLFFSSGDDDNDGTIADGNLIFISSSRVTYTVIEEGVKVYAGTYFNCYFNLEKHSSRIRRIINSSNGGYVQVSMYPKNVSDYPTKLVNVNYLMKPGQNILINDNINYNERTLAVCVRPLFGPFDDVDKLIQFISYYHVMGITQFNFYSMSISPNVRNFLINLSEASQAENLEGEEDGKRLPRFIVNDWNLPTGNTSELWDYGTLAALNDCLFSNIDQEFVLFVDIDEFIVPQKGLLLQPKIEDLSNTKNITLWNIIDSYDKKTTYQFLIRNTFFCNEFCELGQNMNNTGRLGRESEAILFPSLPPPKTSDGDWNGKAIKNFHQLPIFRCILRTKRVWSAALRSKFIVNPRKVLSVGHHLVTKYVNQKMDFRFSPGYSVQVDQKVAVMNHYRECKSISSKSHPILTRIKEMDSTILMFKSRMINFINLLGFIK